MNYLEEREMILKILKRVLQVDDLELKDCAIESLIEMLEDQILEGKDEQ